jgi:hypothetical protein
VPGAKRPCQTAGRDGVIVALAPPDAPPDPAESRVSASDAVGDSDDPQTGQNLPSLTVAPQDGQIISENSIPVHWVH